MTVEIEIGLVRTANRSTKEKSLRLDIGRWTTDAFTMIEHTETSYDQNSKLFRESTIARFTRFLAVPGRVRRFGVTAGFRTTTPFAAATAVTPSLCATIAPAMDRSTFRQTCSLGSPPTTARR
jgi:hypothetical protein